MTLAQLVIDRSAAGLNVTAQDIESIPAVQWEVYWSDLSALCPSRLMPEPVRQRNALRIEVLPDSEPRCSRQSPDGRGLAWFLSGGNPLAYGACRERGCPRKETR